MHAPLLEDFPTEQEVADELDHHVRTIQTWRKTGKMPPHILDGRTIRYSREKIRAWLEAGGMNAPAEQPKRRARR